MSNNLPSLGGKQSNNENNQSPQLTGNPAMLHALANLDSDNLEIKGRAVAALGDVGDESVVTRLLDALQDDSNPSVQNRATFALGRIGARLTHNVALQRHIVDQLLIASIDKDRGEGVWVIQSKPTVIAIGLIGEPAAVRLVELMQEESYPRTASSPIPEVAEEDIYELFIWIHQALEEQDRVIVPLLIPELKSTNRQVRLAAVFALGRIGVPEALPGLLNSELMLDPDTQIQQHVWMGITYIYHEYPHLQEKLNSCLLNFAQKHFHMLDWVGKGELIRMLSEASGEAFVQFFLKLLEEEPNYALNALRGTKTPLAIPKLLTLLTREEEDSLSDLAAKVLGEYQVTQIENVVREWKAQRIVYVLDKFKENSEEATREACLLSIRMADTWLQPEDSNELLPHLAGALTFRVNPHDEHYSHSHPILNVLEKIGDSSVIPAIEPLTRSLDNGAKAIQVMSKISARSSDPEVIEYVSRFLGEEISTWGLGGEPIEQLGVVGTEQAIGPLLSILEHEYRHDP